MFLAHNLFDESFVDHDAICIVFTFNVFFIPCKTVWKTTKSNAVKQWCTVSSGALHILLRIWKKKTSFDLPFIVMAIFHSFLSSFLCYMLHWFFAYSFRQFGELLARSDFNDVYGCVRVQQMIQINIFCCGCCIQSFRQLFDLRWKKGEIKKRNKRFFSKCWGLSTLVYFSGSVDMCTFCDMH